MVHEKKKINQIFQFLFATRIHDKFILIDLFIGWIIRTYFTLRIALIYIRCFFDEL